MFLQNLGVDMSIYDFANIARLSPNGCLPASLGIDFNDTTQPANFEIVCSLGNFNVCIKPTIGELVRPVKMDIKTFQEKQKKLGGMNEHIGKVKCVSNVIEKVTECCNLGVCDNTTDNLR